MTLINNICTMDKETMSTNFGLSRTLKRTGSLSSRTVRIVILGQAAVGKTAMVVRFITRRFIGEYDPTLETIYRHDMSIGGDVVHFEILDTAGQEEDALLIEEKIKWGDGFVIMYSVTDRCSFDEVMRLCFLINHIHSSSGRKFTAEPPPVVIVANKKDLEFDRMESSLQADGEDPKDKLNPTLLAPLAVASASVHSGTSCLSVPDGIQIAGFSFIGHFLLFKLDYDY
ncbi:ras-related and estrogen-regulated growth inhibitor [Esox lucius]|uniref:ras-related and estrogen-regulated growth inhibitor n=1 Tax=Esox lucius TaxID=8010 RepID=UPI00097337F3|nr:ras-related and estrogen-regulated growth inhibitor [Esox lucius]